MFVDRAAGHVPLQLGVLGAVCVGIALIADSAWAIVSGTARLWLAGSPRRLELVGLGLRLAVSGRKD